MKSQIDVSRNQLTVYPDLSRYPLGIVKFVSYVFSGRAHVFIGQSEARTDLSKPGSPVTLRFHKDLGEKGLKNEEVLFRNELEDQKIRSEIRANNQSIREFIVRKALSEPASLREEQSEPQLPESGLTKEQESELDKLITGDL